MDAVKYLEERERLENYYIKHEKICFDFDVIERKKPVRAVEIVEQWSNKNPVKTRQSEFLKFFPNVTLRKNGIINLCPNCLNNEFECDGVCLKCQEKYWSKEVE